MNAAAEQTINAVEIRTEGAGCYERLHAESRSGCPNQRSAIDITAAVEQNNACHEEDGPR